MQQLFHEFVDHFRENQYIFVLLLLNHLSTKCQQNESIRNIVYTAAKCSVKLIIS